MKKLATRVLIYAHLVLVFVFPIAIMAVQRACERVTYLPSVLLIYVFLGIAFVMPLVFLISAIVNPQRFRFFAFLCDLGISIFQLLFIVLPMIS